METEGSISGGAPRTWRKAGHSSANVNIWEFLTDCEDGLIFLCQPWDLEKLFKFNLHGHYNFLINFGNMIVSKSQPNLSLKSLRCGRFGFLLDMGFLRE